MTAPKYENIEFCRNADALWGKIESGHWDWLGVHPDGRFVLGSPCAPRGIESKMIDDLIHEGAVSGEHGVGSRAPLMPVDAHSWYSTQEDAAAGFDQTVREMSDDSKGPGVIRVRQYERGEVLQEEFVVRRPSTYR